VIQNITGSILIVAADIKIKSTKCTVSIIITSNLQTSVQPAPETSYMSGMPHTTLSILSKHNMYIA